MALPPEDMIDAGEAARERRAQLAKEAAAKAAATPAATPQTPQQALAAMEKVLAELQAQTAASKQTSQNKSVEIATIKLETAIDNGDKTAAINAAREIANIQGGSATDKAAAALAAIQAASPKPTLNNANLKRGDFIKWVGGVNGSWQIIKGTGTAVDGGTGDSTSAQNPPTGKKETKREYLGKGASRVLRIYYDDNSFQDFAAPEVATGDTGGPGGLTQDDLNAAINKALASQAAQFQAQQQAALQASRMKAKDKLTAMLAAWKLEGLASWIDSQVMADVSEEMILIGLYDRPEYQKRFPGMETLRKGGRVISEDEYIRIENAMIQTARFFDLPKGFYDGPEDFGALIGKNVSAKEYQDRLQIGQDLARTLNPEVKQQLIDFYGVGEGDLTAYVLDPERALTLIQKQAKAAMFVGFGRGAGFALRDIKAQQAEAIVGTEPYAKLTEAQLKQAVNQAGILRTNQQRLSQIEGMQYNEQEALSAVIEASPEALLASQQRALREISRFSQRGGITGASLRDITAI